MSLYYAQFYSLDNCHRKMWEKVWFRGTDPFKENITTYRMRKKVKASLTNFEKNSLIYKPKICTYG